MKIVKTTIPEVVILEPKVFGDDRGFFMETWQDRHFRESVADVTFVQDNHSKSTKGILRGLHYQLEQTQGKLVRVVSGSVYDVAVDLRQSSPNFGQWVGVELSASNKRMLWVPEGFAHGFYVTSDSAEFVYKCTDYYAPEHEQSLLWDDPSLNIDWPLIDDQQPLLSEKDKQGELFVNAEHFD
ncbi:dTDP-4-dehydrorhamnose 3,5-epimerase [Leucothrix pacifica]|uniref:dTDP-4-dehydrorhamnose 3,5-epimerase n=1 Tax=Leucothrix pacifica TaxID=1247513 RepID=A0A317CBA2_9GAMM|nr:dTDP-4-dehydrorhamnose 3,5-epimerase [Leucothrix pacifica]PWQ95816.1 dTDP-4-dehydrorhamnose 3,5-epimerase [Leucothrix pacifica]